MNKRYLLLIFAFIVLVAAFVVGRSLLFGEKKETSEIIVNTFEECVSAGYPVMESYPRQCNAPGGGNFTEYIGNELQKDDLIKVDSPRPNRAIRSPLIIEGQARGIWYFEASFPVKLYDANGHLLATAIATAKDNWMTEDFVSFEARLEFESPNTEKGTIVFEKDNPTGLAENADELIMPILFSRDVSTRTVELFYYDFEKDKDETGNVMCSRDGLVVVEREIPVSMTPIQDTIRLLLLGKENLTEEEKDAGIDTEYPLEGLMLKGASLTDGVLTLEFNDPNNKTGGGSCRAGVLWFQIEATAKQFPEVSEVKFYPEELFQP